MPLWWRIHPITMYGSKKRICYQFYLRNTVLYIAYTGIDDDVQCKRE